MILAINRLVLFQDTSNYPPLTRFVHRIFLCAADKANGKLY